MSSSIRKIAYSSYSEKNIDGTVKGETDLAELNTKLRVNQGDVVEVSTRFATRGAYYLHISEGTGEAASLTIPGTVLINEGWSSFYWSVLFQAKSTTELAFSICLGKGDLSGDYLINMPSLTAEIIASGPETASFDRPDCLTPFISTINHHGTVILFGLEFDTETNNATMIYYYVMRDDGTWTPKEALDFPDLAEDKSVIAKYQDNDVIKYRYGSDPTEIAVGPIQAVSAGRFVYVFRQTASENTLYADPFVFDTQTQKLARAYQVRYMESGEKYTPKEGVKDQLSFKRGNGDPFYVPTAELLNVQAALHQQFSVLLTPTSVRGEERWQVFTMSAKGLVVTSIRRSQENEFETADMTFDYLNRSKQKETLCVPYAIQIIISLKDPFILKEGDVAATIYAARELKEEKVVLGDMRVLLCVPAIGPDRGDETAVVIDFGVSKDGTLAGSPSAEKDGTRKPELQVASLELGASQINIGPPQEPVVELVETGPYGLKISTGYLDGLSVATTPSLYTSSDGFVYLFGAAKPGLDEGQSNVCRFDAANRRWTFLHDKSLWGQQVRVEEYGSVTSADPDNPTGVLRRCYAFRSGDGTIRLVTNDVAEMDADYLGLASIDEVLVGYVEGAPPVPSVNLTDENAFNQGWYNGIISVSYEQTTTGERRWSRDVDAGIDFTLEGNAAWFEYMLDVSRGWLTSAFVASSTELAETLTVNLTSGKWESIEVNELGEKVEANGTMIDCFVPDNSGMAMLVSSTAKVFALRLKNQPNSIVANRLIPTGKSELIAREYPINPNYIENGFINTYVQDWEALDNKIQREEITQKAFYSQYTPEYESNVPLLDEISRRNFFNVYSWNGGNWYHRETAFTGVTGMEVGGRFDLLGMAGVSAGDPLFDTWNLTMMFGIHEDITVMKGEDSSYTAKMHVDFQADMLDHVKKELKPQIDSYRWQTYYLESSAEHFDKFYQKVVDPDWLVNSTDPDAAGLRNAMDARKPVWRILHRVTWLSAYGALEAFSSPTANALKGAGVQSPYQLTQRVQTDGLDSLPLDADARSEVEAYLSELDWNRPPT